MDSNAGRKLKVLVVDDNRDGAQSLSMLLRIQGHSSRIALDGPSALDGARSFQPDAIFLDIGLPGMDGHQVARVLRAEGCRAVLVALTGFSDPEELTRARESGFDQYLVKPVDFARFEEVLAGVRPVAEGAMGVPESARS